MFINFIAILRILYVVNINVFHTLPLFKCNCCPLKLIAVLMYGSQMMQNVKLFAKQKSQIKAKQTEIKPEIKTNVYPAFPASQLLF